MDQHNILLVDSELLSRDLLNNHLKHLGFKVFATESCAEAGELIPRNRFRLAIINSRFGEKAIEELIARLRGIEEDVLIYLLSSQPVSHDADKLARKGIHDIIIKPFRLDEVKLKLRHAVELLHLRRKVRSYAQQLKKLKAQFKNYETIEKQVKIPDLSQVDIGEDERVSQGSGQEGRLRDFPESSEKKLDAALAKKGISREVDAIDQIRRLDELRQAGILTEEEFSTKKKELLKRI